MSYFYYDKLESGNTLIKVLKFVGPHLDKGSNPKDFFFLTWEFICRAEIFKPFGCSPQ